MELYYYVAISTYNNYSIHDLKQVLTRTAFDSISEFDFKPNNLYRFVSLAVFYPKSSFKN